MKLQTHIKFAIIICAVLLFMIGFHNIDLYYNYHNLAYADITLSGIIISIDTVYMNGCRCLFASLILLILANFININD